MSAEVLSTLINFTVVVFILVYAGRKPIADFFAGRSQQIAKDVDEARHLSTEARRLLENWDAKSKNAQSEIHQQMEDAKASMAKFRESTLAHANNEARRISEEAKTVAAAEMLRAKRALRQQLAIESVEQARQYLESHVDKKDSKKLLTDYLEIVANGHAG